MPSPASSSSIKLTPKPPVVVVPAAEVRSISRSPQPANETRTPVDLLSPAANETRPSDAPPTSGDRPITGSPTATPLPATPVDLTSAAVATLASAETPVVLPAASPATSTPLSVQASAPVAVPLVGSAITTPLPVRPRPILASDALREELAPGSPLAHVGRYLTGSSAAVLLGSSVVLGAWGGSATALRCAVEGGVLAAGAVAVAVSPLTYAVRAHATVAIGALVLVAGLLGHGPAAALVVGPGITLSWEVARVLAAALLPAALMLRAHYRAFVRTRLLLGWGLALALPFVMRSAYLVLLGNSWVERIGAGTSVASVLLALLGFMGAHTTAGSSLWAACLLGSLALDVAMRSALPLDAAWRIDHLVTAAAFLVGAGMTALGLFQSLAHRLAPDARRAVDERCRRRGIAHL